MLTNSSLESTWQHIPPRDSGPIYYGYYLVGAAFFVAQFVSTGMYSCIGSFMAPMTDEPGWSRADFTLTRTIGQMVMAVVGIYIGFGSIGTVAVPLCWWAA